MIFFEDLCEVLIEEVVNSKFASQRVCQICYICYSELMVSNETYYILLRIKLESKAGCISQQTQIWQCIITQSIFNQNKTLVIFLLNQIKLVWADLHVITILVQELKIYKISYPVMIISSQRSQSVFRLKKVILNLQQLL